MTTLTYSLTRQQAADYLWVSTRTIDRYVVKGELRYKKIANKVVLAQEDIERIHADLELVQQAEATGMPTTQVESTNLQTSVSAKQTAADWSSVKEFVELLQDKDKTIEEKNQVIFAMQHQLGQMESRLQQVIALPDYTIEKNNLEHAIENLTQEKTTLEDQVRREKLRNTVYMGLVMIAALVVVVIIFF
jgi:hypothetical protein